MVYLTFYRFSFISVRLERYLTMAQEGMAVLSYVDISPQFINFNQIRTVKWVDDRHVLLAESVGHKATNTLNINNMNWLSKLFGKKNTESNPERYVLRDGELVVSDDSFQAWTSGNLDDMLIAAQSDTNPIDRHFLLQSIVAETYKRREDDKFRDLCIEYSEKHINEFLSKIATALKDDMGGYLPRVLTFQQYPTLLTESGDFNRAIEVCEIAISFGLRDGTKTGFQGRIDRIKKKASSNK